MDFVPDLFGFRERCFDFELLSFRGYLRRAIFCEMSHPINAVAKFLILQGFVVENDSAPPAAKGHRLGVTLGNRWALMFSWVSSEFSGLNFCICLPISNQQQPLQAATCQALDHQPLASSTKIHEQSTINSTTDADYAGGKAEKHQVREPRPEPYPQNPLSVHQRLAKKPAHKNRHPNDFRYKYQKLSVDYDNLVIDLKFYKSEFEKRKVSFDAEQMLKDKDSKILELQTEVQKLKKTLFYKLRHKKSKSIQNMAH